MEKKQRFQILLQQINMHDDRYVPFFQNGQIDKLIVDKKERCWEFHFTLPALLPFEVFLEFYKGIKKAFQQIATVSFTIYVKNPEIDEGLILDYWNFCIHQLEGMSPALLTLLNEQKPKIHGNKLFVQVRNETEALTIKRKYAPLIAAIYQQCGFPPLVLEIDQDYMETAEDYEQFLAANEEEDRLQAEQAMKEWQQMSQKKKANGSATNGALVIGYRILAGEKIWSLHEIMDEERRIVVEGYVFSAETKELRSGRTLLECKITDYTDSIMIKMFSRDNGESAEQLRQVQEGMWIRARGNVQNDTFVRDLVLIANDLNEIKGPERLDTAPEGKKRVELHAHTKMSQMDAVVSAEALIAQAKKWGHPAIAITDHAAVQSFPEAYQAAKKHDMKVIYGMEAYVVDDGVPIAYNPARRKLADETYVVFDVETTGLSAVYDKVIELGAVKIKDGDIVDRFQSFANPHHKLSAFTIELTGITDEMVENAPDPEVVIDRFREWAGNAILVAHNASFDIGFLNAGYRKLGFDYVKNPVIDTLELARFLYPEMKNHRLNTLAKKFNISLENHHRADDDSEATGYLLLRMLQELEERGIVYHDELNDKGKNETAYKRGRPFHCTLLVQNETGLKNLFKIISLANVKYYYRVPRVPRSVLIQHREGILVGSACSDGELFEAAMQKPLEDLEETAEFYDFLEVMPKAVYAPLLESETIQSERQLEEIIKKIVKLGERVNIPVVATGNVHYLHPEDKIYRKILLHYQGGASAHNRNHLPDAHFRTTDEMLEAFSFLGEEKAREIVVENPNKIAALIEDVKPFKEKLYTPKIEGAEETITEMSYQRAREIYGDPLPEIVEKRLEKELQSIIGNGFAVIYLISHKLVKKSVEDGYLVGSRGSVGSSFVATMLEITEVNPLQPHYVCPDCHHSEFFTDGSVGSGYDLPDKNCPNCGCLYHKDGHDIPFETFLGFKGDKVPDIDLNFSGEYQPRAHNYTKVLFGEDHVYRAGTIGTVADKTAYGFVKGYEEDHDLHYRNVEVERLARGLTGVKRTTGQHPGGIIVIPENMEVYDFTPIQYPADDQKAEWRTTHFEYQSIEDNLLKLDILGHDDPTVLRLLQELSGIDPRTIPMDDPEVMKIFSGTEPLGVTPDQILSKTGTLGIPEFGTRFVRQMLEETKPTKFSELLVISGLSHGTDVWLGNAQDLIREGICTLSEVIGCRDDIMVDLMHYGIEPSLAFKIMESVRKGRGLTEEMETAMREHDVPNWYIDSCKKIKYMFPKAHAAAYIINAVRIAWFKVHHPLLFYATYFTVRADDFDLETMVRGANSIREKILEINEKGMQATPKERNLVTVLELALEMCERGFSFQRIDLNKSQATEFIIEGDTLIPPFNAIPGLGNNAARNIVKAREEGEFLSKEDLQTRGKVSKTVMEFLENHGALEDMPEQNQLSLF